MSLVRFLHKHLRMLVFLILSLATYLPVKTQTYPTNQITTRNGLNNNSINSLLEDRDGFIWIGTERGIQRYDGYVFENISEWDSTIDGNSLSIKHIIQHPDLIYFCMQTSPCHNFTIFCNKITSPTGTIAGILVEYYINLFTETKITLMKSFMITLFALVILPQVIISQEVNCDNLDQLVEVYERAWNENKGSLLNAYTAPDPEGSHGDDRHSATSDNFDHGIGKVHSNMKNLKFKILQVCCDDASIASVYRVTGFHEKFQTDIDLLGMTMHTIKQGKITKSIDVHDILPSLLSAGYQIMPPSINGK